MLPTFVVIGAMKAGTTALHRYLDAHPEVFVAEPKELDFFVAHWDRGVDWYASFFEGAGSAVARGEASPNYTKRHDHPEVAARMAATIPDARLVYLVRDPVARAVSMYRSLVVDGVERRDPDTALLEDRDYVLTSSYAYQLEPYLDRFGRDAVCVVLSERLRDERSDTMERVARHLGIDPAGFAARALDREINTAADRRVETRASRFMTRRGAYVRMLNRSWRAREAHRRLLMRHAPSVGAPSSETLRELARRLRGDVQTFVEMGVVEGADGWGLL